MTRQNLTQLILDTDKEILKKIAAGVDGHTLYDPKKFLEFGLNPAVVAYVTRCHTSNPSNPKYQISDMANNPVDEVLGVYGLELLEFIADAFGVTSWKLGRGSRAVHLTEQLLQKLN